MRKRKEGPSSIEPSPGKPRNEAPTALRVPECNNFVCFVSILEGGLAAAAVLISFGVVIGKFNPFQLLVLALVESRFGVGIGRDLPVTISRILIDF